MSDGPKVQLRIEVICADHATAEKIRAEYFPSLDDLLHVEGVSGLTATYTVERAAHE